MEKLAVEDVLDEYGGAARSPEPRERWLTQLPPAVLESMPLIMFGRELAALLTPVQPSPAFRSELRGALLAQARLMGRGAAPASADRLAVFSGGILHSPDWRGLPWDIDDDRQWMWGAAAVGSALSLVGIAAYLLRRSRPAASA